MSTTRRGLKVIAVGLLTGLLAAGSASSHVDVLSQTSRESAASRTVHAVQGVERRLQLADGRRLSLSADGVSLALQEAGQQRVIHTYRLPAPRIHASLTLLPSGRVLLWGGSNAQGAPQGDGVWFDPDLNTLEPARDLGLLPRAGHTATVLTDGRVLFAGGRSGLQAAELWDERSHRSIRVPMRASDVRSGQRAELQSDGRVRFSGGATAAVVSATSDLMFDPLSNQFAHAPAGVRETADAPGLAQSLPAQGAQAVAPEARLSLRFRQPVRMTDLTAGNLVLVGPGGATAVRVTPVENGRLVFVTPKQALFPDSRYTLMVDGVRTPSGARVALIAVDFKTAALPVKEDRAQTATNTVVEGVRATTGTGASHRLPGCEPASGIAQPCRATSMLKDGV